MAYNISGSNAIITGAEGPYGAKAKGAAYGRNAASNYLGYINDFKLSSKPQNPDIFTKSHSAEEMMAEVKKLEDEKMPPVNFNFRYSPAKNPVFAFFSRLFTGSAVNKQALIGASYEAMGKKPSMTVEEADKAFNDKAFKDIDAKLTTKAFDVNNDGVIDVSEEAVSTVLADVLSKDGKENSEINLKKADGSYTNAGENRMMAFLNEKNLETASNIAKDIHSKLGLKKAQERFFKNL